METKLFNQSGKELWMIELCDSVFWLESNEWLVHRALVYQLANARLNVAHSKTRGDRRGSTRKIYKQKGTGRARMGSNRSPVRRKGWVAFGPKNTQNFTLSMNKKERRKALFCLLSEKVRNNLVVVVDEIKLKEIKTKAILDVVKVLPLEKTAILTLSERNEVLEKSVANIPGVKSVLVDYLNIADLLKYKSLILLKSSLEKINALK